MTTLHKENSVQLRLLLPLGVCRPRKKTHIILEAYLLSIDVLMLGNKIDNGKLHSIYIDINKLGQCKMQVEA
jgi:hypothetical protein